MFKHKKEDLN